MLLLALLLAATPTTTFPYDKGIALKHVAPDGGHLQVRGLECQGTGIVCTGAQHGWGVITVGATDAGGGGGSPGGNTNEVQYKSGASTFGGIANVETDGTRLAIVTEHAHPAAPPTGAKHYDFAADAGFPAMPMTADSFMGMGMPVGLMGAAFPTFGTSHNWAWHCTNAHGWGDGTQILTVNTAAGTQTGSVATNTWSSSTFAGRLRHATYATSGAVNSSAGLRHGRQSVWRGDTAGAGGWVAWFRFGYTQARSAQRTAVGLFNQTGVLSATNDPNTALDSVYVGCNTGDTALSVCSNDNSGTATCTSLGASFPCATTGAFYDVWFTAPPHGAVINYFVQRLDSAAQAAGPISSDLPRDTVQLAWQTWMNTGAGNLAVTLAFVNVCIVANY